MSSVLVIMFTLVTCQTNNVLDILDCKEYIIKVISSMLAYFNVIYSKFKITYEAVIRGMIYSNADLRVMKVRTRKKKNLYQKDLSQKIKLLQPQNLPHSDF